MKRFAFVCAAAVAAGSTALAADQTWSGGASGNNTGWFTTSNWVGGAVPGSSSGVTTNTDIATLPSTGTNNPNNTIGINMATPTGNIENLGAFNFTGTVDRAIGDSSATSGTFRLNGATVNSVDNVIIRSAGTAAFTIQNNGGGAGAMDIALGNATNNIINIDSTGSIVISSVVKDASGNSGAKLTLGGVGSGTLTLSASNTYTGGTFINAGSLIANHDGALGTGSVSLTATSVTLTLQNGSANNYISDNANISIVSGGAVANLNFTGTDVVGGITLGGNVQSAAGTYGSLTSNADFKSDFFIGSGTLTLVPEPSTWMMIGLGATLLTSVQRFRRRR